MAHGKVVTSFGGALLAYLGVLYLGCSTWPGGALIGGALLVITWFLASTNCGYTTVVTTVQTCTVSTQGLSLR